MKGRAPEAFETHTEVSQLSGSERPVAASAHIEMVDLRSPRCHSALGPNADRARQLVELSEKGGVNLWSRFTNRSFDGCLCTRLNSYL